MEDEKAGTQNQSKAGRDLGSSDAICIKLFASDFFFQDTVSLT